MVLSKRYCVEYVDGTIECFRDGFWYSSTGIIVKWAILASFFLFFMGWFVGGYIHAKARMKKGKPLLAYHRWLVSYSERRKYGQTPQNSYTFYAHQQPYSQPMHPQHQNQQPYTQRTDGSWPEPPPMYTPGKPEPQGQHQQQGTEMPVYGGQAPPYTAPAPQQQQQQQQQQGQYAGQSQGGEAQQELPPRPPQQARVAVGKMFARFKK